jgi:hypothetical protein
VGYSGAALMMADIVPFGSSSKKLQTLTEQNKELQAKIDKLEAKLAEQQTTLASYARFQQEPGESTRAGRESEAPLIEKQIDEQLTIQQVGALRHYGESLV